MLDTQYTFLIVIIIIIFADKKRLPHSRKGGSVSVTEGLILPVN